MTARTIAVLLVLAHGAVALGADGEMGIPTDGLDIVKLTDGRILRCRVGLEDEGKIELEFPSGILMVPKERISKVRAFDDFDSEPTNPQEEDYVAKGWIKWNGRWMDPEKAAKLRQKEEAPAIARRKQDEAHAKWEDRWKIDTKHFHIEANVSRETLDHFAGILEDYYGYFTKKFGVKLTQRERKKKLPVFIFRDREAYWTFYEKDGGGQGESTRGYFVPVMGQERLVLFDQAGGRKETMRVLFHEATHFILHLADPQVILPRWLHEGLAEHFGTAVRDGKKFVTGRIQDGRLLNFQDMVERSKLVSMDDLMSSGNSYRREGTEPKPFGAEMYAEAWVLVHYLLNGKKGRYAKGFSDYLNKAISGRGGVKYTPISASERKFLALADDQELLRRSIRVKSLDRLLEELKTYGETLPLEGAWAYVERGLYRRWAEKNETGAEADFAKALEVGGNDPAVLVSLANAMSQLGRETDARRHLDEALLLDPLNTDARLFLAGILRGRSAIQELRICVDIDPENARALGALAWTIYTEKIKAPFRAKTEADRTAAEEALALCQRAVAIDPNHDRLDTLGALYLHLGEFEKAREAAAKAVQLEPEQTDYLTRLATAHALLGDRKAFFKTVRRIKQVEMRPRREGGTPPPPKLVSRVLDVKVQDIVAACDAFEKTKEAVLAADTWWQREPPVTPAAWYVYAVAHERAGDKARALEIARKGAEAFPSFGDLSFLVKQLEREVK